MVEAEEVAASDESALASLVAPKLKRRLHFLARKGRCTSSTPRKRCRLLAQAPCNDAGIHKTKESIKQKLRKKKYCTKVLVLSSSEPHGETSTIR